MFTLSAAMLVGTPMTASAAPLNSVFSVSDGTDKDGNESGTGTVTNTDTGSGVLNDSDIAIRGITLDRENIEAVVRNEETLKAQILFEDETKLGLGEDGKQDVDIIKKLESKIHWQVLNADKEWDADVAKALGLSVSAADRTVAKLDPKQGTQKELYVRASINNSWYVKTIRNENGEVTGTEVVEYENKDNATVYEAFAKVTIKEYSTDLKFAWQLPESNPKYCAAPPVYQKHTINLNDYLVRESETSNDTLTWTSSDTKIAKVTAAGVVTIAKTGTFTIYVSGEKKGVGTSWTVTAEEGTPASKIEFIDDAGKSLKKWTPDVDLGSDAGAEWEAGKNVKVKAYAKVYAVVSASDKKHPYIDADVAGQQQANGKYLVANLELPEGTPYIPANKDGTLKKETATPEPLVVTDVIAASSNKTAIIDVKGVNNTSYVDDNGDTVRNVTLIAPGEIGSAKVTAKASSGKSAALTVPVVATLTSLKIGGELKDNDSVYSGMTYQLEDIRTPAGNKDKVTWSVDKVDINGKPKANPNAKINNKGVLTISNKVDLTAGDGKVTVRLVRAANAKKGILLKEDFITINVKQTSIDGISVTSSGENIASVGLDNNKLVTKNGQMLLNVPKNSTLVATVTPGVGNDGIASNELNDALASALTWKSSNTKVVEIRQTKGKQTVLTAKSKGSSNITVSGIRVVGTKASVIKTQIKVTVVQPITAITLNKSSVVLAEKTSVKNGETKYADLKVALKATFGPKNFDKKSDEITKWTYAKWNSEKQTWDEPETVPKNVKKPEQGNLVAASANITLANAKAGERYKIVVATKHGLSATSIVNIVSPTAEVAIADGLTPATDDTPATPNLFKEGKKINVKTLTLRDDFDMKAYVNIGTKKSPRWELAGSSENVEDITYSVNKTGIVTIDNDGTVHAVGTGKVTITAKTPTGKKATLSVTVNLP